MAYEEVTGISPTTKISRSEDLSGDIGAGIFKISGGTRETKEFEISTTRMFFEIEPKLKELPTKHAPEAFSAAQPFWTTGILAIGAISQKQNNELIKEYHHFVIANENDAIEKNLNLATHDSYFSSGYDQLAANKDIYVVSVWEKVEALLQPLLFDKHHGLHLFAPIAIIRKAH